MPKIIKICLACGKEFSIFPAWERKGGGKYCSKQCQILHKSAPDDGLTAVQRSYRLHKERRRAAARAHYLLNRDRLAEDRKRKFLEDPERQRAYWRKHEAANREKRREKTRVSYQKHKEKRQLYAKEYYARNSEKFAEWERAYRENRKKRHAERHETDPQYRLRRALRARLKQAITRDAKGGSAIKLLGCAISELRLHLEGLWTEGMSWNNFGRLGNGKTWQIDHIMPLSSFDLTKPEHVAHACHWTNLQPLWAVDNRRKANKINGRKGVLNAI